MLEAQLMLLVQQPKKIDVAAPATSKTKQTATKKNRSNNNNNKQQQLLESDTQMLEANGKKSYTEHVWSWRQENVSRF